MALSYGFIVRHCPTALSYGIVFVHCLTVFLIKEPLYFNIECSFTLFNIKKFLVYVQSDQLHSLLWHTLFLVIHLIV